VATHTAVRIRRGLFAVAVGVGALGVVAVSSAPAFAQTELAQTQTTQPKPTTAAKECIDKLEKGGAIDDCQKAPSPILPATNELIWGGIAFVLLFFLLAKFAYPGIKQGMDNRAEKIRTGLDEAEHARTDAQRILEEYQRQLADARSESARIIEEARQAADRLRQDLKRQAETEVQELRGRAQEDIQAQVQRAMADLQGRVSELAIELAEKVVERSLDRETNMQLIESYINQVGSTR
jgi:F-type H+-transporting ATPase subunit b